MEKNKERTAYVCNNCRYEFTRKAGSQVLRCPYCASQGSIETKSNDYASKILDEVAGYQ